jgi:sugar/nucleoside kinase (ribokinase family)
VSTVGAGDTFMAGLLLALGRGESLENAACFASAAAAASLQKVGCGFLNRDDVGRFLSETRVSRLVV